MVWGGGGGGGGGGVWGLNAFHWYQIFALDSAAAEVQEMFSSNGSLLTKHGTSGSMNPNLALEASLSRSALKYVKFRQLLLWRKGLKQ